MRQLPALLGSNFTFDIDEHPKPFPPAGAPPPGWQSAVNTDVTRATHDCVFLGGEYWATLAKTGDRFWAEGDGKQALVLVKCLLALSLIHI